MIFCDDSICFATKAASTTAAKSAVETAFFYELQQGMVSKVSCIEDCSIIAAVGESMSNMPGVSGIFFGALGDARINILSISQGFHQPLDTDLSINLYEKYMPPPPSPITHTFTISFLMSKFPLLHLPTPYSHPLSYPSGCDERNISAVVYGRDATRALRAVHAAFWLSSLDLSIGVVGVGRVGSAVLQSLIDQITVLSDRFGINMNIRGIANSRRMLLGDNLVDELRGRIAHMNNSNNNSNNNNNNTSNSSGSGSLGQGIINAVQGTQNGTTNEPSLRRSYSFPAHREAFLDDADGPGKSPVNMTTFLEHLQNASTPHVIIVDASTSQDIAELHPFWLTSGAHVVSHHSCPYPPLRFSSLHFPPPFYPPPTAPLTCLLVLFFSSIMILTIVIFTFLSVFPFSFFSLPFLSLFSLYTFSRFSLLFR